MYVYKLIPEKEKALIYFSTFALHQKAITKLYNVCVQFYIFNNF